MGKRNKSATRLGAAAREDAWRRDLPADVRELIKGRVVDLSSAHEYYKKVWHAVRARLGAVVVERRKERYELATRFFKFFIEAMLNRIRFRQPDRIDGTGADLIVSALFDAGMHYGTTPKPPTHGPITLWPADRPISEAWQMLGKVPPLFTRDVVLEDPGGGRGLRSPGASEYQFPRICLRTWVNGDRSKLPKITIDLEGELACVLMKAMYWSSDPHDQRARRDEANTIWEALFKELRVLVGIGYPGQGRPADLRPEQAAYLKYVCGLPWSEVAKRHCPKRHTHTKKCKDNIRKAVANYFSLLEQDALGLPPVNG